MKVERSVFRLTITSMVGGTSEIHTNVKYWKFTVFEQEAMLVVVLKTKTPKTMYFPLRNIQNFVVEE